MRVFWIVFSGVLLILALFPQLSFWLSSIIGIASPANLVFLLIICLLFGKNIYVDYTGVWNGRKDFCNGSRVSA